MSDLDWLDQIPKLDLHHHLDGAIRTGTMLELAERQGIPLPADTEQGLNEHVQVPPDCRSLTDFLDCFEVFYPLLQEPEAMNQIAVELCEDLSEQGVLYTETRFAPVLMTEKDATIEDHVNAVLDGLREGRENYDVEVNLILCVYRGTPPEASKRVVELAEKYRDRGVVGIDLAGDESQYKASPHAEALRQAREAGLPLTIHAGEAAGVENVEEAVELGASRIGHGVRLAGRERLQETMKEKDVGLEICFTSNLQTQAVESLDQHPFREFYRNGLRVTINTDDPRVSNTDINREYRQAVKAFDLGMEDVRQLLKNAVDLAFVESKVRDNLNDEINRQLNDITPTEVEA